VHARGKCEVLARVRAGDRDRFLATLFAPAPQRRALFALYAFNLELARIREAARHPPHGPPDERYPGQVARPGQDEYARKAVWFDGRGWVIEVAYLDFDGKPALHKDGFARFTNKYDGRGNVTELAYWDADGRAALHKNGYAKVMTRYPQVLINVMGGGDQVSSLKQFVQFGLDKQMAVGGTLFELESIRAVPDGTYRYGFRTDGTGAPVSTLTQSDFTVQDAGKPRPLTSFTGPKDQPAAPAQLHPTSSATPATSPRAARSSWYLIPSTLAISMNATSASSSCAFSPAPPRRSTPSLSAFSATRACVSITTTALDPPSCSPRWPKPDSAA